MKLNKKNQKLFDEMFPEYKLIEKERRKSMASKAAKKTTDKFGFNFDGNKSAWVQIEFHDPTKKQLEHLSDAEEALRKAGVTFDTGYDFDEDKRVWDFDWSLEGAVVTIKKKK